MNEHQKIMIGSKWRFEHWRGDRLIAERIQENLVPNELIDHFLDVVFSGGGQITTWYIALFSNDHAPAAGDTYALPAFTEATGYDEAARPAWSEGGVSAQTISNESSKASFTMDGTDPTLYGGALVSVATKGDTAGGGILGPVAQFSQPMTGIADDDVIKVFATITGSDADA